MFCVFMFVLATVWCNK